MVPKRSRRSKKWTDFSSPGVNIKAKQNSGTRRKTIQNQKVLTQASRLPIKIGLENTIKRWMRQNEQKKKESRKPLVSDVTELLET